MGTKPIQIVKLVLFEVVVLTVICIILGSGLAYAANSYLASHGFKISAIYSGLESFSYGGMKFEFMKSEVNTRSFLIPGITILLCAALVSLIPAFKASKTEPAKTMRIH